MSDETGYNEEYKDVVRRAKERWPECRVTLFGVWPLNIGSIIVEIPIRSTVDDSVYWNGQMVKPIRERHRGPITGWKAEYGPNDPDVGPEYATGSDPIEAIVNAIRAEREDAEEKLAVLAHWEKPVPAEAVRALRNVSECRDAETPGEVVVRVATMSDDRERIASIIKVAREDLSRHDQSMRSASYYGGRGGIDHHLDANVMRDLVKIVERLISE